VYHKTINNKKVELVAKKNKDQQWIVLSTWSNTNQTSLNVPVSFFGKLIKSFKNLLKI
jgi:hypothetical protein